MEPPSTLPGKRVRKRSKRLSETESVGGEIEPARKRAKRGSESSGKNVQGADGEPGRRRRTSRDKGSFAKVSKKLKKMYSNLGKNYFVLSRIRMVENW